ncbi:MAG: hypothetical protein VR68_03890 [Peptococcaceae bacterium BRH_c4a]|nr:MAG: hypothetical protein VR68_03890 [Peptococcaceae bacterium BRH_c4a]
MKKIVILLICFLLAGCDSNKGSITDSTEKEIFPVVDIYLDNAAAGNWKEVFEVLSGEALAEAKANSGRVKSGEKIVSKNLKLTPVCRDVAEVSADFTRASGGGFDRLAYNFRLKKYEDRWRIYKTTYGEYQHGELKFGQLPPETAAVIKTYIELPFNHKRADPHKYLSGKLLQDSQKAKLLPVDSKANKEQENIKTVVKAMDCLGLTGGYAVVRVSYDVIKDNTTYPVEMLVEALDVNGAWKICGMDVTKA